ncbi:hypothetical protein [Serratia entomophila]|uniref:hypothetical protein n=1 Tax=Serratia entomophila TaxID=42906 RepID=UPI00217AD423|nr:hypothetical protein [Serratia entomophila]CAI0729615.1 Uncharacterised protein [Serratia entomophila]CAI1698384.1 Uncharacterised protein [Serratia entomophila]CAI2447476.1 Uncharacterised protein [Serratia entomophila]
MKEIAFSNTLMFKLERGFQFDVLSYKLKEAFSSRGVSLISNFSFGSGTDGLPPNMPRIQLNDSNGFYSIAVSMERVDFNVSCKDFEFSYGKFKDFVLAIYGVFHDLKVNELFKIVSMQVIFPMKNAAFYIREHLWSGSNEFLKGVLTGASIRKVDAIKVNDNSAILRTTSVSDAFEQNQDGTYNTFIHVFREISDQMSIDEESKFSFETLISNGDVQFSQSSIKEILEME